MTVFLSVFRFSPFNKVFLANLSCLWQMSSHVCINIGIYTFFYYFSFAYHLSLCMYLFYTFLADYKFRM